MSYHEPYQYSNHSVGIPPAALPQVGLGPVLTGIISKCMICRLLLVGTLRYKRKERATAGVDLGVGKAGIPQADEYK